MSNYKFIIRVVGFSAIMGFAMACTYHCFDCDYVYSSDMYAYKPMATEVHEGGLEYYVADTSGSEYTGEEGQTPVLYCKFGNMIAVNIVSLGKPGLWKTGNKVVALTGYEGDSPYKAHSESLIVVMDADEGEMSVARPSAIDLQAMTSMRRVEVKDHVVLCYDEMGSCHEIHVQARHRSRFLARIWGRHLISSAEKHRLSREKCREKKWVDPKTGLKWTYVEMDDGVMIENTRTRGCAVSPKPKGVAVIPEFIDGKPVKCIGDNIILNCDISTVRVPKTVERFSERASYSFASCRLSRVEVEEGNKSFQSKNGLLYDVSGKVLLFVPSNVSAVTISEGVTNIADCAFEHCYPLKSVTVPASVRVLGEWVFSMSSVEEVRFLGDAPQVPSESMKGIYSMAPYMLTTYACKDAAGWRVNGELPSMWCDRPIVFE